MHDLLFGIRAIRMLKDGKPRLNKATVTRPKHRRIYLWKAAIKSIDGTFQTGFEAMLYGGKGFVAISFTAVRWLKTQRKTSRDGFINILPDRRLCSWWPNVAARLDGRIANAGDRVRGGEPVWIGQGRNL